VPRGEVACFQRFSLGRCFNGAIPGIVLLHHEQNIDEKDGSGSSVVLRVLGLTRHMLFLYKYPGLKTQGTFYIFMCNVISPIVYGRCDRLVIRKLPIYEMTLALRDTHTCMLVCLNTRVVWLKELSFSKYFEKHWHSPLCARFVGSRRQ
jgi:hypothetical protein